MDLREAKALEIAARCRLTFDGNTWSVPSQSSGNFYAVDLKANPASCTCEDHSLTSKDCKHIIAARLVRERDGVAPAPAIDTNVIPKKPTYAQNWPVYNLAQQTEKDRFQVLLHDLCRGTPNPERAKGKPGRKPTPMADMVFASALKVFTTFSSRRFACDLRDAHEQGYVASVMNSVSVCAFLESDAMTPVLHDLIIKSSLPLKGIETTFAPDSSGFSTSRFVRWFDEKYGTTKSGRDWVKAHVVSGVKTNIVTHVVIEGRDANDCPHFKALIEQTAKNFTVKEVPADKGYLSHENQELVQNLGGTAYIPFKSNSSPGEEGSLWAKMFHYYGYRREDFLKHYHARSNAESTFSMVKAKFRDHVRSRGDVAMKNEVLCKFLCHNIVVVHASQLELGIEAEFWGDKPASQVGDEPATLSFANAACKRIT